MTMEISGRILFADGAPVSGVEVRVFDQDQPGKADDDLTVTPGLSTTDGSFTVCFDIGRFLDYNTIQVGGPLGSLFSGIGAHPDFRIPDPTDILLPYLQFTYEFNGRTRVSSTPVGLFQNEYHLDEFKPIQFLPSRDGFRFCNSFPGYPLPFSVPIFSGKVKVSSKYGLCGGMSSAAYDFALAGRDIPATEAVPNQGTVFQRYLFHRAIDTFGPMGSSIIKLAQWMSLPDDILLGKQKRTYDEFIEIRNRLDDQNLVILGLIYGGASSLGDIAANVWNNHQVLAYGYSQNPDSSFEIHIYDPNFPCRDDIFIQAKPVTVGSLTRIDGTQVPVYSLRCVEKAGAQASIDVLGFMAMPYTPVKPPANL